VVTNNPSFESRNLIRRSVPKEWLDNPPAFLTSLIRDPELFPEIRDESITVYCRGKGFIRDITLKDGKVSGSIHRAYIPIARQDSKYAKLVLGESGFEYSPSLAPVQVGNFDPDCVAAFKPRIRSNCGLKGDLLHRLELRNTNLVVDQEIALQASDVKPFGKIDLCIFDKVVNAFSLIEVKMIDDSRLVPSVMGENPEVIERLARSKNWINRNGKELADVFESIVQMKRRLGMENRLAGIPDLAPRSILSRPALVIGNCTRAQIQEILAGEGVWKPLMDALPAVASGLILFGAAGTNLELQCSGRPTLVFDSSVTS
jgi:hypothetical protein